MVKTAPSILTKTTGEDPDHHFVMFTNIVSYWTLSFWGPTAQNKGSRIIHRLQAFKMDYVHYAV